MPKYLTIKRLVESDELQMPMPTGQIQSMDQFQAAQGAPMKQLMQIEVPEEQPLALPSGDVMSMTLGDFLMKADSINPLIKMGLETFINSHGEQLMQVETPQPQEAPAMDRDVTFSNAIEDQPEIANFDQPEDQFSFPQ